MADIFDIKLVKERKTYAEGWALGSANGTKSTEKNTKFYLSSFDGYSQPYLHYYLSTDKIVFNNDKGYKLKLNIASLTHDGSGYAIVTSKNKHYLSIPESPFGGWPSIYLRNAQIDYGDFKSYAWETPNITEVYDEYSFRIYIPSYAYDTIYADAGKDLQFEYIYYGVSDNTTWQPFHFIANDIGNTGQRSLQYLNALYTGTIFSNAAVIPISYPGIAGGNDNYKLDYYDINIDENGDIESTDSIDTAILMSLFTDKRANPDEIADASLRRGWFGNLFNDIPNYEIGSKLWIHTNQGRENDEILEDINDKALDSLNWMIKDAVVSDINVNSYFENNSLYLNIKFNIKNNIIDKNYKLWEASEWL